MGENEMEPVISTVQETDSLTYWTVKRSIDFLETRDETRPFFLWTSFTKPHPPLDPCVNYWNLYRDVKVPGPIRGDWSERLEDMPQGYLRPTYSLNNAHRMSDDQLKEVKKAYYACITQIDYSLGLLFARMRELSLLENTWIIFTSDHGEMMGDHRMGAKSVFLEGSAHVPFIIRPPFGAKQLHELSGQKCDTIISLADIMPTLLAIAGVEHPNETDGTDILRLIGQNEERTFYGNNGNKYFAIIEGTYKYMWTTLGGDELLFNLDNDPYEQNNLASLSEWTGILELMRMKLMEHLRGYQPDLVKDGKLVCGSTLEGPGSVPKWPGFHSTIEPSDVLH